MNENFLFKLVDVIINAGFVQGIFLAILLNSGKNKQKRANKILSLILLSLSLSIAHSIFILYDFSLAQSNPFKVREPFILLIGPFLLFYVRELQKPQKLSVKDIFHFVPFILFYIILLHLFLFDKESLYYNFISQNSFTFTLTLWILMILQYSIYYVKIFHIIDIHRKNIQSEFSNIEGVSLSWLRVFLSVFLIILVCLSVALPVLIHYGNDKHIDKLITLILSISIFILGYKGLFQVDIFTNLDQNAQTKDNKDDELILQNEIKATEKQIAPQDKETVERLLVYMSKNKPYLNEELTLTGLAIELGLTRNRLSFIINTLLNDNFYNFINKYRVEEVKKYIADPEKTNYTILSLAFDAGFPSKSSFNSIFKKFTGLTPSEYKEKL